MPENKLSRLTGHGLKEGGFDKAVLAVGSTESHGEHLPHGTDSLVARSLAEAVAGRVEGLLVLPELPYGMSEDYASFPVAVSLKTETLMRVLRDILGSLLSHGITRLLVVNGHDGNIPAIEAATREFRTEHPEMRIAVLEAWWVTAGELVPEGTFEVWGGLGHGGDAADAFHVVAPSLPGYGWSGPTTEPGWHVGRTGEAFAALAARLGYDRYGVQGGDWGSMISRHIAQVDPDHVVGCHVNMMAAGPTGADDDFADVTPLEQKLMDRLNWYLAEDNGYFRIQETRPQTLGTALNDSPAGLLSWIGEKFRGWTDNDGDPFTAVDRDRLLTNVSVYWFTQTINSSTRMYFETSKGGHQRGSLGDVPLGVSIFPKEIMGARRRWVEPQFNLTFWADHEVGGHFAALEQPEALVDDLRAFFRPLR